MTNRTFGWDAQALEEADKSVNLDVHGAMEVFHAWARNGGKRAEKIKQILSVPFAKGQFGGKSENMKLARAVLNGLEWNDWSNLELILRRYTAEGHQGPEIFPASHDQINHASAATALLVTSTLKMDSLTSLLIEWHQRQFHLCRLMDSSPLKDKRGQLIGPWGPGDRADKTIYGSNGGRTLAYLAAQGQTIRAAQLADRSNAGALAIKSMSADVRHRLLDVPESLVLAFKLRIGRRPNSRDYIAWFQDAPATFVAVAGVWDGETFASREFGLDDDMEKIEECRGNIEIIG